MKNIRINSSSHKSCYFERHKSMQLEIWECIPVRGVAERHQFLRKRPSQTHGNFNFTKICICISLKHSRKRYSLECTLFCFKMVLSIRVFCFQWFNFDFSPFFHTLVLFVCSTNSFSLICRHHRLLFIVDSACFSPSITGEKIE